MFNKTIYILFIQTIQTRLNFNEKEAQRLIYQIIHKLLMDSLKYKFGMSETQAQFAISNYNLKNHIDNASF